MIKFTSAEVVFEEIPDMVSLAINISGCQIHCPGCHSKFLWEDIGTELTEDVLQKLIDENFGINCLLFMGEGKDPEEVLRLAKIAKSKNLKVGLYTGKTDVPEDYNLVYDYIKVGPYIESRGPLNNPGTNQKMYQIVSGKRIDITSRFYVKKRDL